MKKNKIESYSQEHRKYLQGIKSKHIYVRVAQVGLLFFCIGFWELSAQLGWIDTFITSSPSRIATTIASLYSSGQLFTHVGVTLLETVLGFAIATVIGTLIAMLFWWNDTIRKILDPYIVVLNCLPKIALGPLIIIWIGAGLQSTVLICVLILIIITIISMVNAFSECDKDKILLMQSMGASKWQILTKLILPHSIPSFISMLKINVGMSWVGTIIGEYIVSDAGLGHLIIYGSSVFRLDLVMSSIVLLCFLACIMYFFVASIEKLIRKKRG